MFCFCEDRITHKSKEIGQENLKNSKENLLKIRKGNGDGKAARILLEGYLAAIVLSNAANAVDTQLVAVIWLRFGGNTIPLLDAQRTVICADAQIHRLIGVGILIHIGAEVIEDSAKLLHVESASEGGTTGQVCMYVKASFQILLKFCCQLLHQQTCIVKIRRIPVISI